MPELPDIAAYVTALEERIAGQTLTGVSIAKPFVLRTADPPISTLAGHSVREIRRIGKRIAIGFDDDLWIVIHLMIAGRLQWRAAGANLGVNRATLASFTFPNGTLVLTEAGAKRRASIHVVGGEAAVASIDPGGIEPLESDFETFRAALSAENHTIKRALTDPHVISGVGNAYSDEILHAARLSPTVLTQKLDDAQWKRLYDATQATLHLWIDRFRAEAATEFPTGVTAFRQGMAVHGRFRKPCPVCGTPVQRIRYADNETNYCPQCQTGGKVLADRALSRLLKRG
ncbi:MAG TPA: DNA-formamidopyrimidine glycosylase family protein [Candidatus Baltobacteraceae bacterium]|nr:DNA-formamidopyrimidine glycosylase family protein [Candidatus Baltobacteraceae bacterium]